jgi:hypothetical protein
VPFDDQLRESLDRLVAGLRAHLEANLRSSAEELSKAAAEDRRQASVDAAAAATAAVRAEAERDIADARDKATRDNEEFRRAAEVRIGELARASDKVQMDLDVARAETELVRRERDDARGQIEAAKRETEAVRKTARDEAEEVLVAQLSVAAADHQFKLEAEIARVRGERREAEAGAAVQLLAAIRSLDGARALAEVLDVLTQCGAREAERAAMLIVKGDGLLGWRFSGFTTVAPRPSSMLMSLDEAGIAGEVVRSAASATHASADGNGAATSPVFKASPGLPRFAQGVGGRHAVALPVTVAGVVVAVLYADTKYEGHVAGTRWTAVLEVLTRHASRVLETTTLQQAVGIAPEPLARVSQS